GPPDGGARPEAQHAVPRIAEEVPAGDVQPDDVTQDLIGIRVPVDVDAVGEVAGDEIAGAHAGGEIPRAGVEAADDRARAVAQDAAARIGLIRLADRARKVGTYIVALDHGVRRVEAHVDAVARIARDNIEGVAVGAAYGLTHPVVQHAVERVAHVA